MSCNKCGKCCEVIRLNYGMDYIKKNCSEEKEGSDAHFIINNWVEILFSDVQVVNPHIANIDKNLKGHYFKCKQFDNETRLCKVNGNKHEVCSKYPFYGNDKLEINLCFYSDTCGYNVPDNFEQVVLIHEPIENY